MKIKKLLLVTMAGSLAMSVVNAEISGSGSPNANCATGEIGGKLALNQPLQPGLAGVELRLDNVAHNIHLTAITNSDGAYVFTGLCGSMYELSIQVATVPANLALTTLPQFDDGDWVIVLNDNDTLRTGVDFGFEEVTSTAGCTLDLEAGCTVASLATELYQCDKPFTELSMRWNGSEDVRVVAHYGKSDDPVFAEFDNVAPGDVVTVGGMPDAPNNVEWEVFAAGTDTLLGISRFHTECGDQEMDGPEDCLAPQGNGKDNKSEFMNDWQLYGLKDASGAIDCSEPVVAETCSYQPARADCGSVNEVRMLTFRYSGGDCDSSVHNQPDKFECDGSLNASEPVTVTTKDGDTFSVQSGGVFSTPVDGSDTELELSNSGGTQKLKLHTSCSKPLAAGDVYGGLTLGAINGMGIIAPVDFDYKLSNSGDGAAVAVNIVESVNTLGSTQTALAPQSTTTLHGSAWVTATTTNTLTANGIGAEGLCGAAADLVTAVVAPLPDCALVEIERELHDADVRWTLQANANAPATIERIEVRWPAAAGKLKEAKLDGDKFFDQEVAGPEFVIDVSNISGELHKRQIERNGTRELKLVFKDDIEGLSSEPEVTVYFEEGCSISW